MSSAFLNHVTAGDCRTVLPEFPAASVDLSSPTRHTWPGTGTEAAGRCTATPITPGSSQRLPKHFGCSSAVDCVLAFTAGTRWTSLLRLGKQPASGQLAAWSGQSGMYRAAASCSISTSRHTCWPKARHDNRQCRYQTYCRGATPATACIRPKSRSQGLFR